MKKLFLFGLVCLLSHAVYAANITIRNDTQCDILIEIQAQQAGYPCNIYQQVPVTLHPNSSVVYFDFSSVAWQSPPPAILPANQIWDVVKFGFVNPETECDASGNVGVPTFGWSYTWSSAACSCYGKTVYAKWSVSAATGDVEVVFYN